MMMEKLGQLIDALTTLATTATAYLNSGGYRTLTTTFPGADGIGADISPEPPAEKPEQTEEEKKAEKKAAAAKKRRDTAAAKKAATLAEASATPLAEMTEEQSSTEVFTVAQAYALQFEAATPAGYDRLKAILNNDFKVGAMKDLVHSHRVALIKKLREEMAAG